MLIIGGGTKLYIESPRTSVSSNKAEIYNCDDGKSVELPPLPNAMFGQSVSWDGKSIIYACGGANWSESFSDCYILNLRNNKFK